MLIPVNWLRDFVAIPESPEELADRLTVTGNEIEEIRETPFGPVFYLKLTPNRADMLAMRGIGREIAALYDRPFQDAATELDADGPEAADVRVEVVEPDLCPRYVARIIRGVKIGPSPDWLRERLEAAGERSISNVVDATNYVMLETGQPLHAFDLDKLTGRRILVRKAQPEERFIAIGGQEVTLSADQLVIADDARAIAIAGVKGGQETEVGEDTVDILLESAYFDPVSVRRTSKRLGISTTASYRFERGVDPNGVRPAADRAAQLIAELSGGTVSASVFDVYPSPIAPRRIRYRPDRCRALLGAEVSDAEAEIFLTRLGMIVVRDSPEWSVTAPTYRPDLAIEEDLIEEVGRLYGYDRLPETLPSGVSGAGKLSAQERLTRLVREQLTAQGMFEVVGNTLIGKNQLTLLGNLRFPPVWRGASELDYEQYLTVGQNDDLDGFLVQVRNPLSDEFDTLRPTLLAGLLMTASRNFHLGSRDIYLFEVGHVHIRDIAGPNSQLMVSGVMTGSRWSEVWNAPKGVDADFYAAKGAVEALTTALGIQSLALRAERDGKHPCLRPFASARVFLGEKVLGVVGKIALAESVRSFLDLPKETYVFELDGPTLLEHLDEVRQYEPASRFPRALRDLAVLVDRGVESGAIERILREEMGEFARSVRLFDVYQGPPLPEDKVSLAYALELGVGDRTLTDEEVDTRVENARRRLTAELGAEFRG